MEEVKEIYSPCTRWMRVKEDSRIVWEVDESTITSMVPVVIPERPKPVRDDRGEKFRQFQEKYKKHLNSWREYQFERQFGHKAIKDEEKATLRIRRELLLTHTKPTQSIWENAVSPTRQEAVEKRKPFVPPPVGKAYRSSDYTRAQDTVIKTIEKMRKCFPAKDQKREYSKSEYNLFDCPLAVPLTSPNKVQGYVGNGVRKKDTLKK